MALLLRRCHSLERLPATEAVDVSLVPGGTATFRNHPHLLHDNDLLAIFLLLHNQRVPLRLPQHPRLPQFLQELLLVNLALLLLVHLLLVLALVLVLQQQWCQGLSILGSPVEAAHQVGIS